VGLGLTGETEEEEEEEVVVTEGIGSHDHMNTCSWCKVWPLLTHGDQQQDQEGTTPGGGGQVKVKSSVHCGQRMRHITIIT